MGIIDAIGKYLSERKYLKIDPRTEGSILRALIVRDMPPQQIAHWADCGIDTSEKIKELERRKMISPTVEKFQGEDIYRITELGEAAFYNPCLLLLSLYLLFDDSR